MIRLSCDDGCASDVRVAELATKYKVPCVFYWPVEWHGLAAQHEYEPLSLAEAQTIAKNFEVGSHSITHRLLTRIPQVEAEEEILQSKYFLEVLFGKRTTKFCPPRGYTNPALTEFTLLFYDEQRLTRGPGLVHVHPESGANDNKPWRDCITDDSELWMHSWELDKFDLWDELEEVLRERC